MNEDRLQEVARRLGAREAERLDVEGTAQAVLERLRREPVRRRWPPTWAQPGWLRAAAAVTLLVSAALVARPWREREMRAAAHFVVADLRDLSADQLEELLASLERTLGPEDSRALAPGLDDLSEDELRAVLRSLEG